VKGPVKVLFASGSRAANALVLTRFKEIFPELPLVVVSEFPPAEGEWIPFHIRRTWRDNRDLVKARLGGRDIRLGAVVLEPRIPLRSLRRVGFALSGLRVLLFNEYGQHFMLRPRSMPAMLKHVLWRRKNAVIVQFRKGGLFYKLRQVALDARERELTILYRKAMARGRWLARLRKPAEQRSIPLDVRPAGVSVVIPSRNGRELLERCLSSFSGASEIIVVDNGSTDGSAEMLRRQYPQVAVEISPEPLSFARAVNRGIARARFSHVCLLNNDMLILEPAFFGVLLNAFQSVPELFCATAQIFFPPEARREETGKTVLSPEPGIEEFPVRCDEPLPGEDQSYVLYGSGGCSLYDAAKLAALGGFDEAYDPAYVEDLDLGVRGWLRGWPTVYCADARILHLHRATTSRYFSPQELDRALERNYAKFLARAIADPEIFRRMWSANALRLKVLKKADALRDAGSLAGAPVASGDLKFLHLVNGDAAVFPGRQRSGKPIVLVASPYVPFPLSHGAAVRIFNLMRRAAADFDQVLVAFTEELQPAPPELLEICVEVVFVRRRGTHAPPSTSRPEAVELFDSPTYHAALQQTFRKWRPKIAQLEFTQMALYQPDCAGARTILVEHDITYDLYAQMLQREEDWETRRQYERWVQFEHNAWKQVDRVVTMSGKDRARIEGAVTIANGVDLERFRPSGRDPEPQRLLFIGSFAHKPNVLAIQFFLSEVFPMLPGATLHVIAGQRHTQYWNLHQDRVEVQGFVSDVRPAYERAAVVIAPLVTSAGTNIKIMEAMAMGKAIVSSTAGIHGLSELEPGHDVIVADAAEDMAAAIQRLFTLPAERISLEQHARAKAESLYGWDAIATRQKQLYDSLL
jgi:GT2 family glycosyltransferase/glycosyltransferase involved in cell wall biosynthesis